MKQVVFIAIALLFAAGCASERVSLEVSDEIIGYDENGCEIHFRQTRHGLGDTYTQCPNK